MLQIEKVDFTRFYECKNSQKQRFIYDFSSGSRVIIMTTADSNDGIRLSSPLPNDKIIICVLFRVIKA
ncbi:MAG TPA: hypothetical protein PLK23_07755, partial [Clostridia bacterium]|nr:hypothetical protein [Clostridia bacterium]